MVRKMVTGDARNIVVHVEKEQKELPCSSCGALVMVTVPYMGDILCPECVKGSSYILKVVEKDD